MAIASYHLPDDYLKIPQLVRQTRDDYQLDCERCLLKHGRIIPHLLYFR